MLFYISNNYFLSSTRDVTAADIALTSCGKDATGIADLT